MQPTQKTYNHIDIHAIPFIIQKQYFTHHKEELHTFMCRKPDHAIQAELRELKQRLKPFAVAGQKYLKTEQAAKYLDVSVSFLQKNRGTLFKEGTHFFIPANDTRLIRWDREALEYWIEGKERSDEDKTLISKLLD